VTPPGPVEIELKYQVADLAIGERLLAADRLGGFVPDGEIRVAEHEDTYLDTADGLLEAQRIGVRLRTEDGATTLTVKSPGSVDGALRRREELEGPAEAGSPPASWPASAARDRLIELVGDRPLHETVTIRQFRRKRDFATAEASVELSLDEARIVVDGRTVDRFTELEAELRRGPEEALGPLLGLLDGRPGLSPTVDSKLVRALAAAALARGDRSEPGPAPEPESEPASVTEASAEPVPMTEPQPEAEPAAEPEPEPEPPAQPEPEPAADAELDDDEADLDIDELDEPDEGPDDALLAILDLTHASDDPLEPPEAVEVPVARTKGRRAPAEPDGTAAVAEEARLPTVKNPGVTAEDLHAEAGRKVLRFHLARMLAREAGTRDGTNPEELHGMRVATRRMRAAWRVFGDAYRPDRTKAYRSRLRELAGLLGAVRDLDVLIEATQVYAQAIGGPDRAELEPLLASWRATRDEDRQRLLAKLDSKGYRRFVDEYIDFVSNTGRESIAVETTLPHRVRDTAASRIWAAYEHVRAYEAVLRWADVSTLHQLRIAAKRLRYTLEFVREPLGPDATPLIGRIVSLQDHLGFMNDAEVAATMARTFLVEHGNELTEAQAQAIGRYLVSREREVARLKRTVGSAWRGVAGVSFRRALGRTVAIL
jgi:CHAD domain-containing protein